MRSVTPHIEILIGSCFEPSEDFLKDGDIGIGTDGITNCQTLPIQLPIRRWSVHERSNPAKCRFPLCRRQVWHSLPAWRCFRLLRVRDAPRHLARRHRDTFHLVVATQSTDRAHTSKQLTRLAFRRMKTVGESYLPFAVASIRQSRVGSGRRGRRDIAELR